MQYTADQLEAIESFKEFMYSDTEQFMIITGGAGTGKSTVLRALREHINILNTLHKMGNIPYKNMHITATTNKAVHALKERFIDLNDIDGEPVSTKIKTIYAAMNARLVDGKMVYVPLSAYVTSSRNVIVVDEFSYIDDALLSHLKQYVKLTNSKMIFIGDINQLTPVKSAKMPIETLINDETIRLNYLDQVVRQQNQKLLDVSEALKEFVETGEDIGQGFVPDGKNFIHYKDNEYDKFLDNLKTSISNSTTKYIAHTNADVQEMNKFLFKEIKKRKTFMIGDTLTCNKYFNCNAKDGSIKIKPESEVILTDVKESNFIFEADGSATSVTGVSVTLLGYGGKSFFIPSDYSYFKIIESSMISKETKYRMESTWIDLRPEYALTVHKSQGSTYDNVFIDLECFQHLSDNDDQLSRLLYVACTRARTTLHIIGDI